MEEMPAEDVLLEQEIMPDATGFYQVPAVGGQRSIGLQWPEKRLFSRLALVFKDHRLSQQSTNGSQLTSSRVSGTE